MIKNVYSPDEIPVIMTVPELAAFLGIGRTQAYALARSNQLDTIRIGKNIRIPRHAVLRFLGAPDTQQSV